jgi:hypothetical protein
MVQRFGNGKLRRRLKINFRSRDSYLHTNRGNFETYLDHHISVRTLLKFLGITALFIIILLAVFMLGKMSATSKENKTVNTNTETPLSGETKQTIKSEPVIEDVNESDVIEHTDPVAPPVEEPKQPEVTEEKETAPVVETKAPPAVVPEPEEPYCENTVAQFDFKYSKVNMTVSDMQKELRGDNWGTITSMKITVTNRELCIIVNPTQIKIKLNVKGKGSVWWDDEVFLPDSFKHMMPGATVTEVVPVHVSYSDVYGEKDLKVSLFDDYDITMATERKIMKIV